MPTLQVPSFVEKYPFLTGPLAMDLCEESLKLLYGLPQNLKLFTGQKI
jgi:hypothetical protein